MTSITRIIGAIGVVLLLIGGTGIAWGSYNQALYDCESGSSMSISNLTADETTAPQTEPVGFDNLSSVEQRIFLEAYTSPTNTAETYQNWPTSRFENARVVTYRGQQYRVQGLTSVCGIPPGTYIKYAGIASSIIGVGFLTVTGLKRVS